MAMKGRLVPYVERSSMTRVISNFTSALMTRKSRTSANGARKRRPMICTVTGIISTDITGSSSRLARKCTNVRNAITRLRCITASSFITNAFIPQMPRFFAKSQGVRKRSKPNERLSIMSAEFIKAKEKPNATCAFKVSKADSFESLMVMGVIASCETYLDWSTLTVSCDSSWTNE